MLNVKPTETCRLSPRFSGSSSRSSTAANWRRGWVCLRRKCCGRNSARWRQWRGLLTREAREWWGGSETAAPTTELERERGRERIGFPNREWEKRNSSSDDTSAKTEGLARDSVFNVHEEKKAEAPCCAELQVSVQTYVFFIYYIKTHFSLLESCIVY